MTRELVRVFNYGQWHVEIELVHDIIFKEPTVWCSIDVTGDWRATQGMLTDIDSLCCYDEPEILPKGLRKLIRQRCVNILKRYA